MRNRSWSKNFRSLWTTKKTKRMKIIAFLHYLRIQKILTQWYTRVHDLLVGIFPVSFSRYGIDLDLIIHGTDLWMFLVGGTETERAKCLLSRRPHRGLIRLLQFQQYWRSSDLKMSITTTLYNILIITTRTIYSTLSLSCRLHRSEFSRTS